MFNVSRRRMLRASAYAPLLGTGVLGWAGAAQAATWPERPIRMLVGYNTGGATDGVARPIEAKLQATLGQPLIFEYKPGAGATVAAALASKAAPDGYTLHITDSGPMTILPNGKAVGYDPLTAFTSLGMVCEGCSVIAVHPSLPVENLADLVKMARAKPGTLSFGTSGMGGSAHLAGELFQVMTGTELVHVPYRGGAPAATDLVGGQIPMLFASTGTALPFIEQGRMRALAVTSPKRSSSLPNVPTVAEQGYPGYDATVWFSMVGPARLPPAIVSRFHGALQGALSDAKVQQALRRQGYEPLLGGLDIQDRRVKEDLAKWGNLIREKKIRFE